MWGGLVTAVVAASASVAAPLAVDFSAPEACPPRERFELELFGRTEKVRPAVDGDAAQASVGFKVVLKGKRFVGTLKVRTALSGVTAKELSSARCETLVEAAALTTALLLDPQGARTGPLTAPPAPDAGVAPPPPAPHERLDAGSAVSAPSPALADPQPDAGTSPFDAGTALPTLPDAGPPESAPSVRWDVLAQVGYSQAVTASVEPALGLTVGLEAGVFRFQLGAEFHPGRRVTASAGAVDFRAFGGHLDVLLSFAPVRWLRVEPGLFGGVLAVPLSPVDVEVPRPGSLVLPQAGALLRVPLRLGGLRVGLFGGVGFNLIAPRVVVDGAGVVWSVPVPFSFAGLFVGYGGG